MSQPPKSPAPESQAAPEPLPKPGAEPGSDTLPSMGQAAAVHPVEQTAEAALSSLRQIDSSGPLSSEAEIVPGVRVSFDTERGRIEASHATGTGALLRLSLKVEQPGRWRSLNISLRGGVLQEGDIIGVVADLMASEAAEISLSVRAGRGKHFRDTPFDDRFAVGPGGGVHVALQTVTAGTSLTDRASWRSLMMRLPPQSLDLELRDMRIFVVPAGTVAVPGTAV